ncbi:aryl-sulfate sulfotransferase [Brachybacterium sp. GCM10030267]|uniref:aryl-sulfate sulfotransferase n=1 Tax=Brachybacterium sp. GCM10030267 TaxID=3273381 RepID=UPI00360B0967
MALTSDRPRASLTRRALLAVSGVGALALAGCTEDPDGSTAKATAKLSEYADAYGDHPIRQVGFDVPEGGAAPETYTEQGQSARHDVLQAAREEQEWTAQEPLLVLDPYGTTRTGLYVYFTDAAAGRLSYSVEVLGTEDYSRTAANHAADGSGFEGLVIGLVPGAHNDLTLTWEPERGETVTSRVHVKAPAALSDYSTQLSTEIHDEQALTPGLFALAGVTRREPENSFNTLLFDERGVLRAEFRSGDHSQHNFVSEDGRLVTTTGGRQVSVIDPLGHARTIIDIDGHLAHHDLDVVGDVAYLLTSAENTDRVEDRVMRIDLTSGESAECVDLQKVFPEYEKLAHTQEGEAGGTTAKGKDWTHINSIHVAGGVMYLSSRETSTIIALDDALEADSDPSVRWLIGAQGLYAGTEHEDQFLSPDGSPTEIAGQHSVRRIDDDSLPEGQYYLEMYNNNWWNLGTRDEEDWLDLQPEGSSTDDMEGTSHILRYLVDESAGTFGEDLRVDVAYSSVVSNVQRLGGGTVDDPLVVNSGRYNEFSERAADGTPLAQYRYDSQSMAYRVYKDGFEDFWFAGA